MNRFFVVGIGPGHPDYILPAALKAVEGSDVLIGGRRQLDLFSSLGKEEIVLRSPYSRIFPFIRENCGTRKIALLVSGDPGYHSLLGRVSQYFQPEEFTVYPGLSSFQLALSRIGRQWNDARLLSFHGTSPETADWPEEGLMVMLTDHRNTPKSIADSLLARGYGGRTAYIAENLSYDNERIRKMKLEEIEEEEYRLCVMIVE